MEETKIRLAEPARWPTHGNLPGHHGARALPNKINKGGLWVMSIFPESCYCGLVFQQPDAENIDPTESRHVRTRPQKSGWCLPWWFQCHMESCYGNRLPLVKLFGADHKCLANELQVVPAVHSPRQVHPGRKHTSNRSPTLFIDLSESCFSHSHPYTSPIITVILWLIIPCITLPSWCRRAWYGDGAIGMKNS